MAFWNKKVNENSSIVNFDYKPSISDNISEVFNKITEQFKGEVEQKNVKFPNELGEEHPFDFVQMEELSKRFGIYNAVLDKYNDFIWGSGFYVTCKDDRAKTIIEDFNKDIDLHTIGRAWTREALNKGNGFLELGGSKTKEIKGLKVLNANNMYVKRNEVGEVLKYNQFVGGFKNFNMSKFISDKKVISFDNEQIAHLAFNIIGDCAYGFGIGYPAMRDVDNLLTNESDMHRIYHRKANSPLHAKLGKVDDNVKIIPKPEDVATFGHKMETMDNKTDWATDALVELKVVDFGNIGDKFSAVLEHDIQKLLYDYQIPPELMGMANIPEGLARVRMEAFQKRIQSMQQEIEKVIEQKIFKRVLLINGLDVDVEFEWGTPSIMEVEGRIKTITELTKSVTTSPALRMMLEDEMIDMLDLDKDEWEKLKLEQQAKQEEERKRLEAEPQPIVPGQNQHFPQKVQPKAEQPKQPTSKEMLEPIMTMLLDIEEKRNKAIIEQEQKRNEFILEQEIRRNKVLEENEQSKITQEKEIKVREEQKIDKIEVADKKNKVEISAKQKLRKKKRGLIPDFKITKRTEAVEVIEEPKMEKFNIEEPKIVVKKEKYINRNYEHQKECNHCKESWDNINDIEEWLGFKYSDYIKQILNKVKAYDFNLIKALTETEREAGYLSEEQIDKLKGILDNGFKKGLSMKDMAKAVDSKLELKDLYRMDEAGDIKKGVAGLPILQKSKENRSIGIVRSEVTRLANQGAVDYYKENGINKVRWVASFGDRTCPDCEALNGQIYNIGEQEEMPLHPMCRCTYSPVVEIK